MIKAIRGMRDLVDEEIQRFQFIETKARKIFKCYNYHEIRTPLLEETELFARGVGGSTDIVSKEMYSLLDKNEKSLSLRPENTASVVRYMIENKIDRAQKTTKLFYMGPMFRFERPQKGRFRQFYQIGAEYFGVPTPEADLELFLMLRHFFDEIEFNDYQFVINTIGLQKEDCRIAYKKTLLEYLESSLGQLCEDCKNRMYKNPLRTLDCKNPTCKQLVEDAPKIYEHVCEEAQNYFQSLLNLLEQFNVNYKIDHRLVRGLDYYSQTVFEVTTENLGAQNAVGGGGRYDELFSLYNYPVVPGTGFALGADRISSLIELPQKEEKKIFVLSQDQAIGLKFVHLCRLADWQALSDPFYSSMKSQFKQADKFNAQYTLVLGENEIQQNAMTIKDMKFSKQITIKQEQLNHFLQKPQSFFHD